MTQSRLFQVGALVVLSIAWAGQCHAQYQIESEPRRASSYRVRVINEMGRPICVKIIPYGRNTFFHADLGRGQSIVQELYAGQRVLCVWDDNSGDLLVAGAVNINRNGRLRIRPLFAAAPAEGGLGAKPRAAAPHGLPSIEIEE